MDKSGNEEKGKSWWEGRKFKHSETGHEVKFLSLPASEQKKLNQWVKENAPDKFVDEVVKQPIKEKPQDKPNESKVPKKKHPSKEEGNKKLDDTTKGKDEKTRSLAKSLFDGIYDTNPENAMKLIRLLERYEAI